MSGPILKCRFEHGVIDIVTKVAGGRGGGVRLEEDSEGLEHGAAAGVSTEERVCEIEVA